MNSTTIQSINPHRAAASAGTAPAAAPAPLDPAERMPRTLWAASGFSLALLICFCAAALLDTRELYGANPWLKPAKFALSFVVLHATLAFVAERLSRAVREGWLLHATVTAMLAATAFELFYIGGRAGFGKASHFAQATPLEELAWGLMGLGALTLVAGIGVIGWLAGRDRQARLGPALRSGIALGFGLSALLTLLTAGTLSSLGGPLVGTPTAGAAAISLLGWSAEVGDLRPAHFLALHAMQVLPLAGWWIDRRGGAAGRRAVHAIGAAWALLTIAIYAQALAGLPLLRL